MYQFSSRVRFSETGPDGFLTLPAVFDYFQDGCTFQAEQMGQSVPELIKKNRIWVTAAWQVVIARYPALGEEILVSAIPYKVKGFVAMKNMLMETPAGERLCWANSSWGYLNYTTGTPERLTPEDLAGFVPEEKLDMEYAPRKIREPDSFLSPDFQPGKEYAPFPVLRRHLDANGHVNNCQYVHMACDYLPEDFSVRQVRAEYRKQGRLGDIFYPAVWQQEDLFITAFFSEAGEIYAILEFRK